MVISDMNADILSAIVRMQLRMHLLHYASSLSYSYLHSTQAMTYVTARVSIYQMLCTATVADSTFCTSASMGECPLPSWCNTRFCIVTLIVQGNVLAATPAGLSTATGESREASQAAP